MNVTSVLSKQCAFNGNALVKFQEKMTTSQNTAAQHAVVRFCLQSGLTPTDTFKRMKSTLDFNNVSRALVFNLHKKIKEGYVEPAPRGRPKAEKRADITRVQMAVDEDRRRTVRELADITGLSKSSVQRILTEELSMSHVCARWVPRLLTDDEKRARVVAARQFIRQAESDDTFLGHIITTDETWVHYYEPESKRESMVWKHRDSPPPMKAKACKSMGKVMCIVFMDASGILLVHMVPAGVTVNSAYYSKVRKIILWIFNLK